MGVYERYKEEKEKKQGKLGVYERYQLSKKYSGVDTSKVDENYLNSYNTNANSFFSSEGLQEDSYNKWRGLNDQAEMVRAWAWQNRDKLGNDFNTIMSATDLSESDKYWGQFKSAEDYANTYGEYTAYQEKMNADLAALEAEIAELEKQESFAKSYANPMGIFITGIDFVNKSKKELDKVQEELASKRVYYNEAKNLQAGKAYEEQARLDPEFANISANGAVIAPNGRRVENWVAYYRDPKNYKKTASLKTGHYVNDDQTESLESIAGRQMTDDEFSTYNYLLGKGDKEAAAAYLKSLEYQLNQREASSIAANLKGKSIAEVAWAIPTGLDQFKRGVINAISSVAGEDGYITPSEYQLASPLVREDLSDDGFQVFGSSLGQIAFDTVTTTANMAPSILAATAVNLVAPGAGTYVGAGLMGVSAGGNAYAEAINNGYSKDNAMAYGLFVGASEAALQSVLGGISSMSGAGNLTKLIADKANAINNVLLRVAAKYGISVMGEITEEELQNFLEPLFRTIFLGEEYDMPTIEELVHTALVTAISTGVLKSGGVINSEISENNTYKNTYGEAQKDLVAEGLELDPQNRYYKRLNEKLNRGKDLTGNEIRNVVSRNERAISKLEKNEAATEVAEEKSATDTAVDKTSQDAVKIASESVKGADVQTVTERENAPAAKETAEQAEAVRETSKEDVQTALEKASRDYGAQAKAMAATYIEGQDVAEYNAAFRIAYDMGASGVKLSYVEGMESYLTDSQKKIAYEAGKASQDTRAKRLEKSNAKKETGGTQRKKGVVRGEGVSIQELSAKFNDTQREAYSIMSSIAEVTGIDIVLYKSEADAKGNFTEAQGKYKKSEPGTLYIDINAGLNNIKSAGDLANYTMLRTFSHEFVHFIENWNPVWYNELRRVVFDHLENADELISREAAESALPYERASREVVAEALTDILPDSTFIEDLANNHKNIFEKLYAKLKEFVASIKSHFASLSPNANKAAQTLKQSGKYAEEIVKLFDKAAAGAVEKYQATVAEQKVESDGNVIEMAKAESQQIDKEKPKKIASTEAVIEEINAEGMVEIDTDGKTVAPQYSRRTWTESEYVTDREKTAKAISKELGVSVETALSFIDNINAVSKLIADDKARLDYAPNAVDNASVLKPNSDYKWSVDMSTLCAKRLLFTGTFDAIQRIMADTAFDSEDIVRLRQMMEERGYEVACGFCYVESMRRELGPITQDFINRYKLSQKTGKPISRINSEGKEVELTKTKEQMKTTVDASTNKFFPEDGYTPTMADLNTTDIDLVKKNHPQVYEAYLNFMNARGQAKPKLLETRAEYKGEILRTFKYKSAVNSRNNAGGLRLQSFSDFEVPHLIDMMQIALDMARVGLKSQAYTKVPAFAKVFGNTGIKINLSLVAKGSGLDADGNLVFDDKEGMPHEEAFRLRDRFSKNVGTILVGKNDAHIIAAMADPRIDFIIPFHKSSWKESLYDALGLTGYEDYTNTQNEKPIDPSREISNVDPSEYWDFSKTGDENAQIYLEKCKEDGRIPKFPQFQGYPGYWKLLIDFKMYDNDGAGSPQEVVRPIYDEQSQADIKEIFDTYKGGHGTLPVAQDIVDDFVKEYKEQKGVQYSRRQQTDQAYMDAVESGDMEAAQRMVDEAAKEAGYTYHLYHGTNADFTKFDLRKYGGKNGKGEGYGIYLAENREISAPYGKNVIDSYTRFNRLAEGNKKTLSYAEVKKLVKKSCEIDAQRAVEDGEYDTVAEAIRDTWVSNYVYTYDYSSMSQVYADVANILWENNDNDGELINEIMASSGAHYDYNNALNFYDTVLTPTTGIDGFHYIWGNKDGSGVQNDIYLAFSSNQIKSADPVTYDDNGNVIPLSERFDEAQEDIRYQRRANYVPGLASGKPGEGMSYEVNVKDYTLKEVANMYHLGNLGAEYDALFDKVYAVCENMGIVFDAVPIIRNEEGNEVPGVNTGDRVSFNVRSFNSTKADNEYKSKVILHEMLHAATTYALRKYADKRRGATVNMPKNIYDSCAEMERVFNAIKNNPLFEKEYGIENGKEMIAELSNPDFVNKLKASYPSAWHGLLDQICKLFGINKSFTNYDKLKKAVDEILAHPDYQLAKEHFSLVDKNATYLDESQYADADIQEQRRDGRMTDQEVLAYAVDMYESDPSSMALSDAEKNAFELFKQRLAKLDDLTAQRYEQGQIYRENTFQKGGDRAKAQKAHNRMDVLDGQIARASAQLLSVKEKTVLQGVLQKARKVVEQQERARGDEKLNRWRDRRENAAKIKKYRDRIESDYKDLVDWLNHPLNKDVTKHVNENIKGIVIPFLLTFDFTSQRQLRGGEATKADKEHVKQAQKLLAMLDGLDEDVRYSGEYDLPLNFSERLAKHVKTVQSLMDAYGGEMVINKMTAAELRELSLLMANLKTAITTLNKFHTNAMFAHVSAAGDTTIRDLKALKDYDGNAVDTFLFWKNIRPDYAWDRFGSGGRSINLALREGQSKLAWNAKAIIDYAQSTFTAKEREEWENKVVEVSISYGRKVNTTVAALMSFYELSKRAQGRKHILDGGVTVSDVEIRESKFAKKKRISGRYGRFTEADIEAMNAALTDRQREVADKLQQFMEKQGGEWGNHVTLARFGERAFGEKGYFPISVDKQSLSTNTDKQIKGADLYRLLNMGFTKELSENTRQPLLLYSIFEVFSTHMADMAQYNAMALPVLDAIRWLNYKEYDLDTGEEKNNLRAQMKRAFGSPVVQGRQSIGYAESFVLHILQAYNGTEAQGTPGDSLGMKMLHTYNRAQIAFNVRVVVQQPMALTRAAMILNPKYIAMALDPKKIKENVEDMLAHSGIAAWKDLGYYDINISRGLAQMIKQESTVTEKVTEVGLKPAEWADKATWGVIWAACKMQLKAQGVTNYAKVEQLFDDVIYKTQVVDSVLTKSEYMRDKGFFARSTASFMSEPTTTASMMLDAYDQYRMDIRRGMSAKQAWAVHNRNIGRTVLVYSVGAIMLAAVQAAVDGLRDDDDYQSLPEKWNEAFWSNLLDELSPLNKLPLVSTIWELFKVGLDTFTNLDVYGNPPSAAWAQWFDTLAKAWEITMELVNGETNYTWYAAIYKYLQVASGLSGLPFAAMTREAITLWNNTVGAFAPSLKVKSYELKEVTEIKYAVLDGYLSAQEAADELWEQGLAASREEAAYTAEAWEFVKDNPEYSDLTVSAYSLYKENCEGVDIGYFYQAWKYYNQTKADYDKNGEPISGSKKRKVLDFIYQMRIPTEQKKKIIKCFYK